MASLIPISPAVNHQRIGVAFATERIYVTAHWNSRDDAWYLDLERDDGSAIAYGIKVVLGIALGADQMTRSLWLQTHVLRAIDTSGKNVEAGFLDLGTRVLVFVTTAEEITGRA